MVTGDVLPQADVDVTVELLWGTSSCEIDRIIRYLDRFMYLVRQLAIYGEF
jgi:hypothetical protein